MLPLRGARRPRLGSGQGQLLRVSRAHGQRVPGQPGPVLLRAVVGARAVSGQHVGAFELARDPLRGAVAGALDTADGCGRRVFGRSLTPGHFVLQGDHVLTTCLFVAHARSLLGKRFANFAFVSFHS